jgi:hypothetical protein
VGTSAASPHDLVLVAARNNAFLCDAVSRAHGIRPHFGDDAWTSARRTPPLYPDAVTLRVGITVESVLARVDSSAGCSIKDSFGTLSLAAHGFNLLIEAEWIFRDASEPGHPGGSNTGIAWHEVSDEKDLALWEDAWSDHVVPPTFSPSLIADGLVFLAAFDGDSVVGGAIVNPTDDVVGLSNVFAKGMPRREMWPGCIDAISERFPGLPIVGYESSTALRGATGYGFMPLGSLRVWQRDE